MNLISLALVDSENSLQTYSFDFSSGRDETNFLDPLCFVGLNGSGKSKLLEVLAKIYFEMDRLWRSTAKNKPTVSVDFRFVYSLSSSGKRKIVSVEGVAGRPLVVNVDGEEIKSTDIKQVMPSNIIGYSSGHNETISELFHELREREFKLIRSQVDSGLQGNRELSRTLFLDRNTTKLLLLSAFIFSGTQGRDGYPTVESSQALVKKFSELIHLQQLLSFQIVIDTDSGRIVLSQRMEKTLEKLKRCALMSSNSEDGKGRSFVLDFFFCDVVKKSFVREFGSVQDFFEQLYELSSLNLISNGKAKQHLVFILPEKELKVLVKPPLAETHYFNLSDGEHQFIQIFTAMVLFARKDSIFLLDEPESHFNPAWRAKFVLFMDELLCVEQKKSEFLISTHSPYLVSACRKKNVFKFSRNFEGKGVECEPLIDETFGASFDVLLRNLFDMKGLVAEVARSALQEVVQGEGSSQYKLQRLNDDFGDSFEKRLLINMLEKGLFDAV